MEKNLTFLCGFYENLSFVYGVKDKGDWHYFEEKDSIIDAHGSLPADLEQRIKALRKVTPIPIVLDANQVPDYMVNDTFVFKGKPLETFLGISSRPNRKKGYSTDDLVFISGETNPSLFLDSFEKCIDVKTDKDKLYKIRNFVNEEDKAEFTKYFFKNEYENARRVFLKKYSLIFTENKKRALSFQFDEETSLRSFVYRKFIAFSKYTTLGLKNQLEVILAELPSEISNLFILHLKNNSTKIEILEFCDSIQDFVDGDDISDSETSGNTTLIPQSQQQHQGAVVQDLEIFACQSSSGETEETELDSFEGRSSTSSRIRKRRRGERSVNCGGPSKIVRLSSEDSETSRSSASSVSNY